MEDKLKDSLSDTVHLDRLDAEIELNNKMFQENLRKARLILKGAMPEDTTNRLKAGLIRLLEKIQNILLRPVVRRQTQMDALLINMLQDLSRLQILLSEKASLKKRECTVPHTPDNDMLAFLYMVNHPLYRMDRTKPCVVQVVASLNFGDAVGNDVLAMKQALEEEGYVTAVYAGSINMNIRQNGVFHLSYLPELKKEDIVIYHFASSDSFAENIKQLKCKIVLRYHNVTPPKYFCDFDPNSENITKKALLQVRNLSEAVTSVMTVSEFNKQDLLAMHYQCPMDVVPILIPFSDYEQKPERKVLEQYKDGRTNIIFVGRGAPNKKIEDVIRCFLAYKRRYDAKARLFLIGNYDKSGSYFAYLQQLLRKEHTKDVIFPGHISFAEILAYYRIANVFLCMSEHEGFCVPLVEAMFFDVPIVAYRASAISETLGKAGILLDSKEPDVAAFEIDRIVSDREAAAQLILLGRERLKDFGYENVKKHLIDSLKRIDEMKTKK